MFNHVIKLFVLLALSLVAIQAVAKDKPKVETRIGYLTDQPMQHPRVSDRDDYLDIYDKQGKWQSQIIVVFKKGVKSPRDRAVPIEVKGRIEVIDLGGAPGTRGSYSNIVLYVDSWKALNPKQVSRSKN